MKEVANSYSVDCWGADANLKESVQASLTVYEDGSRQIGCPFINLSGQCQAPSETQSDFRNNIEKQIGSSCVHLFPVNSLEAS